MELAPISPTAPVLHLRAADDADATFFFALRAAVMGPLWQIEFDEPDWIERHLHGPPEDFQAEQTRIAMVGPELAGILHMVPWKRSLTIRWLMIDPAFQGRGIGTQLVRLVQQEAIALERYVLLEVLTCNVDAKRLYERLGFGSAMVLAHSTWMQWPAHQADVS